MDILTQAAKFMRERKNYRRWLAAVLCLALVVAVGTVIVLKESGSAMTHKRRVLDCHAAVHEHSDECYGEDGSLVCGLADFLIHKHNDDCYDENGELVCTLPEISEHIHTDECYKEEKVLVCTLEESEGHIHTEECCGEDGSLICGVAEGEGAHRHGDECFEMQKTLVCELPEAVLHTHVKAEDTRAAESESGSETADADESAEPESCYDSDGKLVCGRLQLEEHIHDKNCFKIVELTPEEVDAMNEAGHVHGKGCYDSNGERICGFEDNEAVPDGDAAEKYDYSRAVNGDGFTAVVMYNDGADFPKDAVFNAERITAEDDAEHFEERAAEFKSAADDENARLLALLRLSMMANGEEISPKEPVRVSVSFTGDEIPEDTTPTLAVRFADWGNELIQSGDVKDSAVSFDVSGLSEIAVGVDAKTEADRKNENTEKIALDETFEYKDDSFTVVFSIEGDAAAPKDEIVDSEEKPQVVVEPIDNKSDEYAAAAEVYGEEGEDDIIALQLLTYSVVQNGVKLDLSDCEIKAEVKPAEALAEQIKKLEPSAENGSENEASISAMEFVSAENEPDGEEPAEKEAVEIIEAKTLTAENMDAPMTMSLRADGTDGIVAFSATSQANPSFTVTYTAPLRTIDFSETDTGWSVIDTSKKPGEAAPKLPQNGIAPEKKYIKINSDGTVATKETITKIYSDETFQYIQSPGLIYINKVSGSSSYSLNRMEITFGAQHTTYPLNGGQSYHFTNKQQTYDEETAKGHTNYILIKDGIVINLVYDVVQKTPSNQAEFYDYDISTGDMYRDRNENSKMADDIRKTVVEANQWQKYMKIYQQGINNNNCTFGFGNANSYTGLHDKAWNKAYSPNDSAGKSYFGIPNRLDSNGHIVYSNIPGLTVPKLFNDGEANGKTVYENGRLTFKQSGDMYTLTGTTVTDNAGNTSTLTDLDKLKPNSNPHHTEYHSKKHLYSNSFFPLDNVASAGGFGHDLKFGAYDTKLGALKNDGFPESDDGKNHNHYFGMHYEVEFEMTSDYAGPLEYLFYGDDDLWVFLTSIDENCSQHYDGQLILDIGGVHSSIGEYVNLRDYLPDLSSGKYKLSIFYTERGASGSTCYMHFTLPSVSFSTVEQDTGRLKVEKKVSGVASANDEFGFEIKFKDKNGDPLRDDYSYSKYDINSTTPVERDVLVWNDSKFTLRAGQYIVIDFLPDGSTYEINEVGPVTNVTGGEGEALQWTPLNNDPYKSTVSIGGSAFTETKEAAGSVAKKTTVSVIYDNVISFKLPETGGVGTAAIYITGAAVVGAAVLLLCVYYIRRKRANTENA